MKKQIDEILKYQELGTGSCSLKVLNGIGGGCAWDSPAGFKKKIERRTSEKVYDDEPLTHLTWVRLGTFDEDKFLEENQREIAILLDMGFVPLGTFPGGHGKYLMGLMAYTQNANRYGMADA